jgi:signal transduction histidine kinase/ligand-binding sensor domain-containing protein/DNA-binding response OmpR family regulator
LAGAGLASSLDPLPNVPYVHETFTVDDGLPMAGISEVLQTRDGYLWLATFDRLVRFDGARFEVFDSERVPALGSNRIYDLVETRDGSLWMRTEQGHVVRYQGGVFSACSRPQRGGRARCDLRQAGAAYYSHIYEDPDGTLWLGGPTGLFQFVDGEVREVPGLTTDSPVVDILRARTGRLWVSTPSSLWVGRPGRFERASLPPGAFELDYPRLAEDGQGKIWISTASAAGWMRQGRFVPEVQGWGFVGGDAKGSIWFAQPRSVQRYRAGRFETVASAPAGENPLIPERSIAIGPDGAVWIAWGRRLLRNGVPVLELSSEQENFNSIFVDRNGTLWLPGRLSGELHALHPTRLTTLTAGLQDTNLRPIYEDRDGTILVGGGYSIGSLAPGSVRFQSVDAPGRLQTPSAFLRDRTGTLWIGTTRGLFSSGGGGFTPAPLEALRTAPVGAIYEDTRGVLWVGTDDDLFRREPDSRGGRWSQVPGLPRPRIRVIRETKDGTLWLGTNGRGVIRLAHAVNGANGRWTPVTRAQGLSSNLVRGIYVAPDGRIWIATENRGLNRLDPATVDRPGTRARIDTLGERQGLYSNGIHQMVPDGYGNLWMSSNQGIFRARFSDMNAVADGRLARLESAAYTERDGMVKREANGGVQDSGLRDRAGRIWFPTQAGAVRIDPRQVLRGQKPPRPEVQRLRVGDEEVPLAGGAVRLTPDQRSFAVEFTAPSFQAPERQKFRFRLTPYDRDWIDSGNQRAAFYTKVPPGSYVFEVLAASPDGAWSERPATVSLEVVPRFFETGWFLFACALAATAAVGGAVRLRGARLRSRQQALERMVAERTATIAEQAEKLRELDRLKSQFFANISHEFRTPLTLILGPLRDALDGGMGPLSSDLAGQLAVAARNAQRLLGLVDQLLDVAKLDAGRLRLRPREGDLPTFLRRRVEAFLPLAERREIELSLEAPAEAVEVYFDEMQLEKVLDNLIGNALKFSLRGGRVRVTLAAPPGADRVEVSVCDNGPGIPADQLERVFDRFYQVEATARRRWPGAGLGLALARQLIELHGGSIAVESAEGSGARFTVTLLRGRKHFPADLVEEETPVTALRPSGPLVLPAILPSEPSGLEDEAEPDPEDDRTTVLVVDDNPEIRAYIRRHLEPTYRVVEAADGVEGLARARSLVPDLVVSDVMMPGLDGNALFRGLREDPELETVPVVLLTAKASAESRIQGLREGVDDYLVKPFDPRELKARVDNLIASRRRLLERFETVPKPLRASPAAPAVVTSADEALLARVQAMVEARLADPELTVESLAEALSCDRSYLLRKLRALTNETPSGLIRSLRLQRAEQLLRAGAGTVSEVAYGVGFKSVAHFSNAFQERYGERPSAFAARHRNG